MRVTSPQQPGVLAFEHFQFPQPLGIQIPLFAQALDLPRYQPP
jgi:hypothetical protein